MTRFPKRLALITALVSLLAISATACGSDDDASPDGTADGPRRITVYSGRSENLVKPLFEQFTQATGIEVSVRYADSAALAAQLIEEGTRTPADVFFSQDAGALGALANRDEFAAVPDEAYDAVDPRFRSKDGTWVGVSGRARVIIYNPEKVPDAEVPTSVFELTDPKWKGRVGFAPTNASFQAFVTAMRVQVGDDRTREWLRGLEANDPRTFPGNAPIVEAVDKGEVDLGLVNHYYLYERIKAVGADQVKARNAFTTDGDPGALVNVAGVGILAATKAPAAAAEFVTYLLSEPGQRFFAESTFEYPLAAGVEPSTDLPALADIESPDIDLSSLDTLEQTLNMIRDVGLL